MALTLKSGVLFVSVHSKIIEVLPIIDRVYQMFGINGVITSIRDGVHKTNSLHYKGRAIDLRTRDLTDLQRPEFHFELANAVGSDYDVVLEKDHVHLEYDPK